MFNPADDEPVSTMRYSAAAVSGNAANYADEDDAAVGAAANPSADGGNRRESLEYLPPQIRQKEITSFRHPARKAASAATPIENSNCLLSKPSPCLEKIQ